MVNKQAILKRRQRRAQAEAEIAAAARPAALPPEDAPMSPHLDLGSWREWDKAVRACRAGGNELKQVLSFMLPLLVGQVLLVMAAGSIPLSIILSILILSFFPFGLIALRAFGCFAVKQHFFEKVIITEGLICPKCKISLESSAAPDQWSCRQCASSYTGEQLTRLIGGRFSRFCKNSNMNQDAMPDRLSIVFRWLYAYILLIYLALIAWVYARQVFNSWTVWSFFVLALLLVSWGLLRFAIRLRFEPYSRCAHCFHTVPKNAALPELCSECGCGWHVPGGLLHHRIEWRPLGYGGVALMALSLTLLINGIYRDWQLNQALQSPATASASVLIAKLEQEQGDWFSDTEVIQQELHQRKLTPAETDALAGVYMRRFERDADIGYLGWPFLISAVESGQLDRAITKSLADLCMSCYESDPNIGGFGWPFLISAVASWQLDAAIVDGLFEKSCRMTLWSQAEWKQGMYGYLGVGFRVKPGFVPQVLAARLVVNGQDQFDQRLTSWGFGQANVALSNKRQITAKENVLNMSYVPTGEENQVEITVWLAAPGVEIKKESHRTVGYLSQNQVPGVWSQVERITRTAAVIPVLSFEKQHLDPNGEPYFRLPGRGIIRPRPLTASEVSTIQDFKATLGGSAPDPIFKIFPILIGVQEHVLQVVSSERPEIDQLLVEYIEAADISVDGKEPLYVQIDLDSLHPAVAEVTP